MGSDAAEVEVLPHTRAIKVHRLMCAELMKFVDRISQIFPAIESARPRCSSGIGALCSLNQAMDKAKLILQYCTESSKLYLAITGNAIVSRCEKVRNALELSLSQIQNLVPLLLAAQISGIVDDLRDAKFSMESSEEKAGKVVVALLLQESVSSETSEFQAFQIAALSLHITSPKAFLIEKRSIKMLLRKVRDTDQKKATILINLLSILNKYEKSIGGEQTVNVSGQCEGLCSSTNSACNSAVCDQSIEPAPHVGFLSSTPIPPEEFKCPISFKLMHDPVVIASGKTFERVWIERWFNEGHDTCPKTQKKLSHLSIVPNSDMKNLISKWCREQGISIPDPCAQLIPAALLSWKTSSSSSIASLGSSLNDVPIRIDVSNVSFGSSYTSSCSDSSQIKIIDSLSLGSPRMCSVNFGHGTNSRFLPKLDALPWESQCKVVEDVKNQLKDNDQACHSMLSKSIVESLIRFLKDASDRHNVKAQQVGAEVLLAFVSKSRSEIPYLCEDLFHLLASFLDSKITEEALAIMQVLSDDQCCKSKIMASGALPSILKIINSQSREFQTPAVKILYNLSSHSNIGSHILFLGCVTKLIPLLGDSSLAGHCIKILKNLCNTEEGRFAIAEANGCIASIAELIETGTHEEQEHAVAVLHSLCSHHFEHCLLVLNEGVIPSLVDVSINGNTKGKENAKELLRLLRDIRYSDSVESSPPATGSNLELPWDSGNCSIEKKPSSKVPRFFGRKITIFAKHRSSARVN